MRKPIVGLVIALAVSSHSCFAQTAKPAVVATPRTSSMVGLKHWLFDPLSDSLQIGAPLQTIPFQDFTTPTKVYVPFSPNWRLAELTLRLSELRPGMQYKAVLQRILILGGREDGGVQSNPATRFYFESGILVNIPLRGGLLSGPLQITTGSFHCD